MSSLLGGDDALLRKLVDVVDVAHTGKGLKQQRRNAKTNRGKRKQNCFFCETGLGDGLGRLGGRLGRVAGRPVARPRPAVGPALLAARDSTILGGKNDEKTSISWEIGKIKARERKQGWRGS